LLLGGINLFLLCIKGGVVLWFLPFGFCFSIEFCYPLFR